MLVFGSWGTLLTVPMIGMVLGGELPTGDAHVAALTIVSLGLALLYTALRAFLARIHLERDRDELYLHRRPLWPWRERRWRIDDITHVRIEIYPESFRHPGTWRGRPIARPFAVVLTLRDGKDERIPLALGEGDAAEVASGLRAMGIPPA